MKSTKKILIKKHCKRKRKKKKRMGIKFDKKTPNEDETWKKAEKIKLQLKELGLNSKD